jgi:hypothetical protein
MEVSITTDYRKRPLFTVRLAECGGRTYGAGERSRGAVVTFAARSVSPCGTFRSFPPRGRQKPRLRGARVCLMIWHRFHATSGKFPHDVFFQKSLRFWRLLQRGIHVGQRQTADE